MNLLIVDDQAEVLDGIRTSIDWQEIKEIHHVFYAYDAIEAKNCFLSHPVDILISDIEMPGENGLELVSWAGANYPETKCLLLTAHASFDYAQDALRLKAVDYILQPVRYEVLKESIQRTINLILRERTERSPIAKNAFWDSFHEEAEKVLLQNYFSGGTLAECLEKAEQIHIPLTKNGVYYLIMIDETLESSSLDNWAEGSNKSMLLSLARQFFSRLSTYFCVFEQYSHHFWMLFLPSDPEEDLYAITQSFIDFCRENYQISMVAYLGGKCSLSELPDIYRQLYDKYRNNVAYTKKLITLADEPPKIPAPMPASSSWAQHFCNRTTDVIENAISQYLFRMANDGSMDSKTLLELQQLFLNTFYESLHIRRFRMRGMFEQEDLFDAYRLSLHSIHDFLHFVRKICEYNRTLTPNPEEDERSIVEAAQEYITSHLSEDLSRETIAQAIHVSESYLSHLFSRETGLSLTDYITRERMILAKSFLSTSNLPVQIIAIKAGYNNISYFIRTFKKVFGMTPNAFRNEKAEKSPGMSD